MSQMSKVAKRSPILLRSNQKSWAESPMMTIWPRFEELTVLHIVWSPDVDLPVGRLLRSPVSPSLEGT